MKPIRITLEDLERTRLLAGALARIVGKAPGPQTAILLRGGLGAGKTTLTRELVEHLPGAKDAEVASPSFNIFNLYPTTPPVAHFDLYRAEHAEPDEDFFDQVADPEVLVIVEWAEHLSENDLPRDRLLVKIHTEGETRELEISAIGEESLRIAKEIATFPPTDT